MLEKHMILKLRSKFVILLLITVVSLGMTWWALCPGYLHMDCWNGVSTYGSPELEIVRAHYGPVILRTRIWKGVTPQKYSAPVIAEKLYIWKSDETMTRLLLNCGLFWLFICYLIIRRNEKQATA
jgi:hypothetical protein